MNLEQVRKSRGLHFLKIGMKVIQGEKTGKITRGNNSGNINVIFEGEKISCNCHPYWDIAYLDKDGSIIKDFRKGMI